MASGINGIGNVKKYLNSTGQRLGNQFNKEIIDRSRKLSIQLQQELNASVDKGVVPFTNRAILFTYRKRGAQSITATILVKDIQAKYLYEVIVKPKPIDKFIPTTAARLTKQGNISGLQKNLMNGRYKIVKSKNGKERLIDTSKKDTKNKTKRVIGLRESKRRKLIFDFYAKAEQGVRLAFHDIQGTFIIRKN